MDNPDFNATCSMGIAVGRTGNISYEEMFGMADHALYQAKANGKNKYHIEYIPGEAAENGNSESSEPANLPGIYCNNVCIPIKTASEPEWLPGT